MTSDWITIRAADFIDFNPRLSIKKGTVATKISMDKLKPFSKQIPETDTAEFSGGAKFSNGDTIMARITPCLENGKTAYVDILEDGEIAFGSTEFIVMRARKGISDPQFIYYLATSPMFRSIAIKSMVGSSGRQRVQQGVLDELELYVPSLEGQEHIGAFLAKIDKKIALNEEVNDNLQQQVFALFDASFVSLEQNEGAMPSQWSKGSLGDIVSITNGKRPPMKQALPSEDACIPLVGAASIMGYTNAILYNEPILVTGRVGTHGVVQRFRSPCWTSDNTLVIKSEFYEYAYQALLRVDYVNMNRGSTQPLITQTDLKNVPITLPTKAEIQEFEKTAGTLMAMYEANRRENEKLVALRDSLLPKLMSGEIDVSNIQL